MIESEAQFLYMLCLYGPFVQRFQSENQQHRCFFEVWANYNDFCGKKFLRFHGFFFVCFFLSKNWCK